MSKIVLSAAGSAGDIFPLIGLAADCAARGHEPVIATQAEYRSRVEAQGVGFHALRQAKTRSKPASASIRRSSCGSPRARVGARVRRAPHRDAVPEALVRRHVRYVCGRFAGDHPHLGLRRAAWPRKSADCRGSPTVLAPFAFMSAYDPPMFARVAASRAGPQAVRARFRSERCCTCVKLAIAPWTDTYRHLREDLGLPRTPMPLFEGQFSPFGTLALYSRHFGSVQPDFPSSHDARGIQLLDGDGGDSR